MHIMKQISQWETMRSGRGVQKIGVPKTVYQLNDPQTDYLFNLFSRNLPRGKTIQQLAIDPAFNPQRKIFNSKTNLLSYLA